MAYGIKINKGKKRVIIHSTPDKIATYKTKAKAQKEVNTYLIKGKKKGKVLSRSLNPRIFKL